MLLLLIMATHEDIINCYYSVWFSACLPSPLHRTVWGHLYEATLNGTPTVRIQHDSLWMTDWLLCHCVGFVHTLCALSIVISLRNICTEKIIKIYFLLHIHQQFRDRSISAPVFFVGKSSQPFQLNYFQQTYSPFPSSSSACPNSPLPSSSWTRSVWYDDWELS